MCIRDRFYPQFDDEIYRKYLNIFKLNENKVMNNFSKGMKRQAFILIALAISPKLLLLDESFDGLDPMMRLLFKRAISECIEKKKDVYKRQLLKYGECFMRIIQSLLMVCWELCSLLLLLFYSVPF